MNHEVENSLHILIICWKPCVWRGEDGWPFCRYYRSRAFAYIRYEQEIDATLTRALPDSTPLLSDGDVTVYTDEQNASVFKGKTSLEAMLSAHLPRIQSGDYFAINAVERTDAVHAIFHRIRTNIRATKQVATTLGYDPRFLHSVGQLHKGGPNSGVFIQVIGDAREDLSIPGEP